MREYAAQRIARALKYDPGVVVSRRTGTGRRGWAGGITAETVARVSTASLLSRSNNVIASPAVRPRRQSGAVG